MPVNPADPIGTVSHASANGLLGQPVPDIGILAQFGPLGNSELNPPSDPTSIVGLAAGSATAVFAASEKGMGVHGMNDAPAGSSHKPPFGCGVWGESTNGIGVFGSTENGIGVFGAGATAGQFEGAVMINGNLTMLNNGDVILGDCAEEFECSNLSARAEPGYVMVLDDSGVIRPCSEGYERGTVGVVSGAGTFRPAIVQDRVKDAENRAPIALIGKVCCWVDADFGPIRVGDLLTTSPSTGHAMKAIDPTRAFGAVIGKALQPLAGGKALISILVTLQ